MCGLSGIVGPSAGAMTDTLVRMMNVQVHRGPDDGGMALSDAVALGHNRLAILDTSVNGRQPMKSADGRFSLIFNGEIYNYIELRKEIGGWYRSGSDTEVLLEAFRKWGPDCVDRLRGMFAFAIWDRDQRVLFIARDRFGIKPLYYATRDGHFFFASEIKGLLAAEVPRRPNMAVIAEYLTAGLLDHRAATFFEGISRLMPGHTLSVEANGRVGERRRYYFLPERIDPEIANLDLDAARTLYRSVLDQTIDIHLRSDVPIGISLSGGIDSSALLSLGLRAGAPQFTTHAFLYDFADERYSERQRVRCTLDRVGGQLHACVMDDTACDRAFEAVTWSQGEPFGGVPTMAMASVYGAAREQDVTVLLNGNGADDSLAGSRREATSYLYGLYETGPKNLFEREARGYAETWGVGRDAVMAMLANLADAGERPYGADNTMPVAAAAVVPVYRQRYDPGPLPERFAGSPIRQGLYRRMVYNKIPRTLRYDDHNSMASSREVRVPFLDHELVELSFSLSESNLVRDGLGKAILRDSLKGEIPESVRIRPKQSVQSPQREWFKDGPMARRVTRALEDPCDLLADILDIGVAKQCYDRYCAGDDSNSNYLWQWINLDSWYRLYIADFRPHDHSPTGTTGEAQYSRV